MSENRPLVLAQYENKYGERREIHRTRHGLRTVQRATPTMLAIRAMAVLIAERLKRERISRGWTLLETGNRMGWMDGNVKARVWGIENCGTRGEGVRLGTLFSFAEVFGVDVRELMPSSAEVRAAIAKARGGGQ